MVYSLIVVTFVGDMQKNINIKNKKAKFEYEILDTYVAGIVLSGTEIKSIRLGRASISESFCEFNDLSELFDRGLSRQARPLTNEECAQYLNGRACFTAED